MAGRTITEPAEGSGLISAVIRNQLQLLEDEVLTMEVPTGTVNASNNVFTVLHEPVYVVVDGAIRVEVADINDIGGNGYTYAAGTLTVNSSVPPVSFIRSFYNS